MKTLNFTIKHGKKYPSITSYASHIVHEASQFASNMTLDIEGSRVDLKSILGVVSIGLYENKQGSIIIEGFDEEEAYERLEAILNN